MGESLMKFIISIIHTMKIKVPYPPWRSFLLPLLTCFFLIGNQVQAQSKAQLRLEFSQALSGLPGPNELENLPPKSRTQVLDTRDLYERGTHIDEMNTAQLAQFSLTLKANTALSQQILRALLGKNCIQGCVLKRKTCQKRCPRPAGLACKCCLHCNLLLDLCVTNCLLENQTRNSGIPAN